VTQYEHLTQGDSVPQFEHLTQGDSVPQFEHLSVDLYEDSTSLHQSSTNADPAEAPTEILPALAAKSDPSKLNRAVDWLLTDHGWPMWAGFGMAITGLGLGALWVWFVPL